MQDLIIIGGGAAGLGAGLYAARFKLSVSIIAKEFGGTGNIAHLVDNWIGDPGVGGYDLMQKFIKHVEQYQVPMIQSTIMSVEKTSGGYAVVLEDGARHEAKAILFANGMQHKKLGVPGEEEYAGRGVHYCYTCDGPLYKNKVLAVAGGSDSAALGTLFLAEYGSKLYTIFRKDTMTAEPISVEKVSKHEKVELIPRANIVEIIGDGNHVKQLKLDTGRVINLDGLFIEIGHLPLSELAKKLGVATNDHGYIIVDRKQATNLAGVYAAGDITNATELKQFITSAAEGSIAAQSVYHWIQGMGETHANVQ